MTGSTNGWSSAKHLRINYASVNDLLSTELKTLNITKVHNILERFFIYQGKPTLSLVLLETFLETIVRRLLQLTVEIDENLHPSVFGLSVITLETILIFSLDPF